MLSVSIMGNFEDNIRKFIVNPNLPSSNVSDVLIGEEFLPYFTDFFAKKGISVHKIASNSAFLTPISSHADMLCCHLGGNRVVFADITANFSIISSLNLCAIPAKSNFSADYPRDIPLNMAIFGKNMVHNIEYSDAAAMQELTGLNKINVKQGYSKCSICVVDENSIITDDIGIASAVKLNGIDVLYIEKGDIKLKGFDYGFIGGCTFKVNKNEIAFTGRFDNAAWAKSVFYFLQKKNITYTYMTDEPIFDVGSIIPIKEFKGRG